MKKEAITENCLFFCMYGEKTGDIKMRIGRSELLLNKGKKQTTLQRVITLP